jgi:DTW domain-containing protein YfiP
MNAAMSAERNCPKCEKPDNLCVCAAIEPLDNRIFTLILRHPQEQDRKLGTAKIASLQLKNSIVRTGLSWANLAKALGRPAAEPKKWGVLYLGTAKTSEGLNAQPLTVVDKKGVPVPGQESLLSGIEGIILLDGNWAQAKALWWRNAWLLKCRRLVLQPGRPSLYGNLRKEPRRESVSTIEAAAMTIAALESDPAIADKILTPFRALLDKARSKPKKIEKENT